MMSRADDHTRFGRKIAAARASSHDRPRADWLVWPGMPGRAVGAVRCPLLRPASAPPAPPAAVSWHRAAQHPAAAQRPTEASRGLIGRTRTAATAPLAGQAAPSRRAPVLCAACARPVEEELADRRSFLASVVWGLLWRYAVLGALVLVAQSQAQKPWLVIAGVVVGGLLPGLWRQRWAVARLWRTVVVAGGAVYVAPLFSVPGRARWLDRCTPRWRPWLPPGAGARFWRAGVECKGMLAANLVMRSSLTRSDIGADDWRGVSQWPTQATAVYRDGPRDDEPNRRPSPSPVRKVASALSRVRSLRARTQETRTQGLARGPHNARAK